MCPCRPMQNAGGNIEIKIHKRYSTPLVVEGRSDAPGLYPFVEEHGVCTHINIDQDNDLPFCLLHNDDYFRPTAYSDGSWMGARNRRVFVVERVFVFVVCFPPFFFTISFGGRC